MKRREFLSASIAAAALAKVSAFAAAPASKQEYYELRAYRLNSSGDHELLDGYLEKAAIPALNRLGSSPVGAFVKAEPKNDPVVYLLIPFESLDAFAKSTTALPADSQYLSAGKEYLQTAKAKPGFVRIDSWLLRAFAGMPKLDLPAYSKEKKDRIFEIRTYESYSEAKALKKVDMFNSGEIEVMHEVGLGPIFFGQALTGPNLPHLTYMLSAENEDEHKKHWGKFGSHPTWDKMKSDPQYADTVSKIYNFILKPLPCSQI